MKVFFITSFFLTINHLASAQFIEKSREVGIHHLIDFDQSAMGGGAVFLDFNNDGFEDLYITGGLGSDFLYQNLGNGSFENVAESSGVREWTEGKYTFGVISGDIDNDGCEDLFITTFDRSEENILLLNDCHGRFENIASQSGLIEKSSSTTATFIDINKDGLLDIYVTNYIDRFQFQTDEQGVIVDIDRKCLNNFFYLNEGKLKFKEVSNEWGLSDAGCGLAVISTDMDEDGDQDIYLANDHGEWVETNKFFRNDWPDPFCSEVSSATGMDIGFYAMGIANGDYDLDGIQDYYITNLGDNALLKSLDIGFYQEVAEASGVANGFYQNGNHVVGWGAVFLDYDHDTDLDLYVSNGYVRAGYFSITTQKEDFDVLFENLGNGQFEPLSLAFNPGAGQINRGLVCGDADRDGDLDLFCVSLAESASQRSSYLENQNANGNWIALKLEGTISNRNAFGTIVKFYIGEKIIMRELVSGGSHASQNSQLIHAGLGSITLLDSMMVQWPFGEREKFSNITANNHYYLKEFSGELMIAGCMDPNSDTYNPEANYNTACYYPVIYGCTDPDALNYDNGATVDDQSCAYTTITTETPRIGPRLTLFPNPAKEHFQIQMESPNFNADFDVDILDAVGRYVIRLADVRQNQIIDLSDLSGGIYFVKIFDKKQNSIIAVKEISKI